MVADRTHAFGKWHLGMASFDHTPAGRGFDNWDLGAAHYEALTEEIVQRLGTDIAKA